jgi:hypothetical protein
MWILACFRLLFGLVLFFGSNEALTQGEKDAICGLIGTCFGLFPHGDCLHVDSFCNWSSSLETCENDHVTSLRLNLNGDGVNNNGCSLPSEFGQLSYLRSLSITNGAWPLAGLSHIGSLSHLTTLGIHVTISRVESADCIFPELANLVALKSLEFVCTSLTE